jgi:hypothetical protein
VSGKAAQERQICYELKHIKAISAYNEYKSQQNGDSGKMIFSK